MSHETEEYPWLGVAGGLLFVAIGIGMIRHGVAARRRDGAEPPPLEDFWRHTAVGWYQEHPVGTAAQGGVVVLVGAAIVVVSLWAALH